MVYLVKLSIMSYALNFKLEVARTYNSFIWIENVPRLTAENIDNYILWADSIISAKFPDIDNDPRLHDLVKTYQIHRHSKTCRKYRKDNCRFHFGIYFINRTIIAKQLPQSFSDLEKQTFLKERIILLTPVSEYINNELNTVKPNFWDTSRDDYKEFLSIVDILTFLGTSVRDYYNVLSISNDYQIHLCRTNS